MMQAEATKRRVPSVEQAEARLKAATESAEKARAAADKSAEAYTEALAFDDAAVSTKRKQLDQAKEALQRAEDELRGAKLAHTGAVKSEAGKAEAARKRKLEAKFRDHADALRGVDQALDELADKLRAVHVAEGEIWGLATQAERQSIKWHFEKVRGSLALVIATRLKFYPGMANEQGLRWDVKSDRWAHYCAKNFPAPVAADEEAAA